MRRGPAEADSVPLVTEAFREAAPTTTVFELKEGETVLRNVSSEALKYWLKDYTMGELFRTGELEDILRRVSAVSGS